MKKLLVVIAVISILSGCVMDVKPQKEELNRDILLEPGNDPASDVPTTLPEDNGPAKPDTPASSDSPTTTPRKSEGTTVGKGINQQNPDNLSGTPLQGIVPTHESMSFQAEIFRTNSFQDKKEYPEVIFIESREQLDDYLNKNKDSFDLSRIETAKYDQTFFATQSLALLILQENSGSISHVVEDVYVNDGVMSFQIKRNVPEIGTADMAEYHIFVSLKKDEMFTSRSVVVFS